MTNVVSRVLRNPFGVAPAVVLLSLASFFNDVASELLLKGALPLYLVGVLGAPMAMVGLIDGLAEAIATFLQLGSGYWSDRIGRRRPFVIAGYVLSNVVKPLLYFTGMWWHVLVIRVVDRVGKGFRVAPRDALIADVTPPESRGRAFGLHHAMDPAGAMVSLLIGAAVIFFAQEDHASLTKATFQKLILVIIVPGLLTVLLAVAVKEPRRHVTLAHPKFSLRGVRSLGTPFLRFVAITGLFTLGNSTDSFIILRAASLGTSLPMLFVWLAAFNLMSVLFSVPAGRLSDRLGRKRFLALGWVIYGLVYAGFGFATKPVHIFLLLLCYGVYYGITESVSKALIADLVTPESRGTAFGLVSVVHGLFILPAGVIAGWMWGAFSPAAPFLFGGVLALLSALALVTVSTARKVPTLKVNHEQNNAVS